MLDYADVVVFERITFLAAKLAAYDQAQKDVVTLLARKNRRLRELSSEITAAHRAGNKVLEQRLRDELAALKAQRPAELSDEMMRVAEKAVPLGDILGNAVFGYDQMLMHCCRSPWPVTGAQHAISMEANGLYGWNDRPGIPIPRPAQQPEALPPLEVKRLSSLVQAAGKK